MKTASSFNEKELFIQISNGDKLAFDQLYTSFYGVLYLHALQKLKDREIAKDMVHDLFLTIWQNRETLHVSGSASVYLHTSIRNKVIDYFSKEKSKSKYLDSLGLQLEKTLDSTDYLVRERDLQDQIENILFQLPPRIREIFILSRQQYLTHKQIATKLNITEQSVRTYIKSALKVFRMRLSFIPWIALLLYCKYF